MAVLPDPMYFTGMNGEAHDEAVRNGTNYIVWEDEQGNTNYFEERSVAETQAWLNQNLWREWARVRAISPGRALEQYDDAISQWRLFSNAPKTYWEQHGITQLLEMVNLPWELRPETIRDLV